MTDFLVGGSAWWALPALLLTLGVVFGFFPGFVLRLLVLLYPPDDPRRRELVAELYVLRRMARIEWVFQQLETALFEGVSARLKQRRSRRWIEMTDVRQMEAATRALRSLDYHYGGGFCWDAVVAQLSWGQRMLLVSGSERDRQRLFVAIADLHNLAGWVSFEVGRTDSARDHFDRALELASAGGSDELVANVLFRMGRVHLRQKSPGDALEMFQRGQVAARRSGSELAVAVICANQAWVHSMMGHKDEATAFSCRARTAFARLDTAAVESWEKGVGVEPHHSRAEDMARVDFIEKLLRR